MVGAMNWRGVGGKWGRAAVLAAAVAGATAGAGCDSDAFDDGALTHLEAKVPSDFVARKARDPRVTLKAPKTWRQTAASGNVVLNMTTDVPGSSVNVVVIPANEGETLDKTMGALPEQLSREFANFDHVETDYLIVNDLPAGRIVYEASRAGFDGKLMQVVITRENTHYILTYTATPENYEQEIETVEQVLASLKIP
jgi:hypothetical protein